MASSSKVAEARPDAEAGSGGERALLYAREVRVGKSVEAFTHWTRRITNEAGLQSNSQLNVDFDPSYQTLTFHYVAVIRGEVRIDKLDAGSIKLVQRQAGLENQIFDSRESAVLFLPDLRVGDVVDYAYSVTGADPTLAGKYEDRFLLGLSLPMDHLFMRVLLDRDRALSVSVRGPTPANDSSLAPRISHDSTEYRWDLWATKANPIESNAPEWFDPVPFAVLSEFKSWAEVARWGARFFSPEPPLKGAARAWFDQNFDPDAGSEFVLRAAHFVQDEIRYVGIEVGMARRAASDPNATFERRYGDCKDKTALLVALLRAAKLDAVPVLVSLTHGPRLNDDPPSAEVFDHAIVRVSLSGVDYFIDPTIALQGGRLDRLRYSPYALALLLSEGTSRLTALRSEPQERATLAIRDHLGLHEPASKVEATLDTTRTYRATVADGLRAQLRGMDADQRSKFYLGLYQQDYPSIHELAPIEEHDDRTSDVLTVTAHFGIPDIWQWDASQSRHQAKVSASSLQWLLPAPSASTRVTPLAAPFPVFARQDIELDLPFDLPKLSAEPASIETRATSFNFHSSYANRRLTYDYEIFSKARAVAPADMGAQASAVDRARELMRRTILYRPGLAGGTARGVNWLIVPLAFLIFIGSGALSWWSFRAKRSIANTRLSRGEPIPFGGWIWLVVLGVSCSPFLLARACFTELKLLLSLASWQALTTHGTETYRPGLAVVLCLGSLFDLVFFNYSLVLVASLYRKARSFPWHYCLFVLTFAAVCLAQSIALSFISDHPDTADHYLSPMRAIINAAIWITYLRQSGRVARTFTRAPRRKRSRRRATPELLASSDVG
jgi:hypothetical protein